MGAKNEKFELSKVEQKEMTGLIQEFFLKEREEEIGDLQADMILDFIVDKLSDKFYNKGVYDSYVYMNDRTSDLLGLQK